jgi:hypothetical protein
VATFEGLQARRNGTTCVSAVARLRGMTQVSFQRQFLGLIPPAGVIRLIHFAPAFAPVLLIVPLVDLTLESWGWDEN